MPIGADLFKVNPNAQVHVKTTSVGCPVLIIDDFYAEPDKVRTAALAGHYDSSLAYYPGMHSRIKPEDLYPTLDTLSQLLSMMGDFNCTRKDFSSDFSIVTTPAKEMLANQKHPHIDPSPLAGIAYLNPDYEIGTSMFRNIPLDLAIVTTEDDHKRYAEWIEQNSEQYEPETYAISDDKVWQHIYTIEGRYNRLVMYPGNQFHSIAMKDVAANPTMATARLTQRFFVMSVDESTHK